MHGTSAREREPDAPGRVILVDDSPVVRDVVSERLADSGWIVRVASGGAEALELVRDWQADVVVCDLHMPDIPGLDVIGQILQIDRTLPVVVLSGDDDLGAVLRAVRGGAFDYVLKHDRDLQSLDTAVERAVAHARLVRENQRLTHALEEANRELGRHIRELRAQHGLVARAQARSASLLRNILPEAIAERLMDEGETVADGFDAVTVMFADVVGFTRLAALRPPIEIVELLHNIVSRFDVLSERYEVEKIKTIGDAYMVAAGLPRPRADHAEAVAEMALEMLEVVAAVSEQTSTPLSIRIGMHTGPVVAGVIGTKKFSYDVWGDTVNVASRMEASSVPGRIQLTDETRHLLMERYEFEERGPIAVKGKGLVRTWFLRGRLA
ncbi:adenylate/guanylate cyclase domain-containing protein [Haliangium ochraceum]|uniref:Adenylate cyclase n=1 Tax=Haliangium ochraceum (strain DSM 14365 / JCM 11303 / SMP-2) TaxID=502025 RepID=D0LYX8_HALO1|nr:adenylate/guanylate cyclase domain-containing protein [Haliangium ochraceum]ACY14448.1 adenylate/guanylate cyclase [Haliangium ochraceum DSM 14365]